jgi:hypothetical protein
MDVFLVDTPSYLGHCVASNGTGGSDPAWGPRRGEPKPETAEQLETSQKLAGIGRERFDVAALALRVSTARCSCSPPAVVDVAAKP